MSDASDREARRGPIYTEAIGSMLHELLAEQVSVRLRVTGGSMSPFIRTGDLVTIQPRSKTPFRIGDVVAVKIATGKLVVHRVVRTTVDHFVTRGDATSQSDPPVTMVLGPVSTVERKGRRVRLGLGPERRLIAILSRTGLLRLLLRPVRFIVRTIKAACHID
jgi:hypothetical protein